MKTNDKKLTGVPTEAKQAEYFVRVICKHEDVYVCEGYKPSVKPKNPVNRFSFFFDKEIGGYRTHEFMVCGGMQSAITPLNALLWMTAEKKNALLNELAADGAVMF